MKKLLVSLTILTIIMGLSVQAAVEKGYISVNTSANTEKVQLKQQTKNTNIYLKYFILIHFSFYISQKEL